MGTDTLLNTVTMNKVGLFGCVVMLVVLGLCVAEPEPEPGKGKGVYYSSYRPVYRPRPVYHRPVYHKSKGKGFKSKGYKSKGYGRSVYVSRPVYQPSYSSGYGHW